MLTKRALVKYGRILEMDAWWDQWDVDIDWEDGIGNQSKEKRLKEIARSAQLLNYAYEILSRRKVQTWLLLHRYDSREDRLYIHSANNRNKTEWPLRFTKVYRQANISRIPKHLLTVEKYLSCSAKWFKGGQELRNFWMVVPAGMEF